MDISLKNSIEQSVLCWLATADDTGQPNVSPKEVFAAFDDQFIIVANIASPNTEKNIRQNPRVCISFIDVFVQKGYQVKGEATIVKPPSPEYPAMETILLRITEGKFPFHSITKITIESTKPILAPRYWLYPETTEEEQVERAKRSFGVMD